MKKFSESEKSEIIELALSDHTSRSRRQRFPDKIFIWN